MPKFLAGKVVVRTFETWADSPEEAQEIIKRWQESESEEPEGGVKATSYKLGWEEFNEMNPIKQRNMVLQEFLNLMQKVIPGVPSEQKAKSNLIILPFDAK